MKNIFFVLLMIFSFWSCQNKTKEDKNMREPTSIKTHQIRESDQLKMGDSSGPIFPIEHGSFGLRLNHQMIYVDPMGNSTLYADLPDANLVLVTHYHPDYLVPSAIEALVTEKTVLLVPPSVNSILPAQLKKRAKLISPQKDTIFQDIHIRALNAKHQPNKKGGFLLSNNKKRIFISGNLQDLPDMDELKDIDLALMQMNLSDPSSLDKMVANILEINPKKVYPYYYRGEFLYSLVSVLKNKVEAKNPNIEVKVLNWYPDQKESVL